MSGENANAAVVHVEAEVHAEMSNERVSEAAVFVEMSSENVNEAAVHAEINAEEVAAMTGSARSIVATDVGTLLHQRLASDAAQVLQHDVRHLHQLFPPLARPTKQSQNLAIASGKRDCVK